MATLRIFLGNPRKMELNWYHLEDMVWFYFPKSVKKTKKFDKVIVKMTTTKPQMAPEDILVYVVPSQAKGVIGERFGAFEKSENQIGMTLWEGSLFASEIYVRHYSQEPARLASFVWHEALHAKLKANNGMHNKGGFAADPVGDKLTDGNVKDMAGALDNHRKWWLDPFDRTYGSGPIVFD